MKTKLNEQTTITWSETGKDNFGNMTFKVNFPNYVYNGVKLPTSLPHQRRHRIFLRKDTYINIEITPAANDNTLTLKIGRYKVQWDHNKNLGAYGPNKRISNRLAALSPTRDNIETAIAIVLDGIKADGREWRKKTKKNIPLNKNLSE